MTGLAITDFASKEEALNLLALPTPPQNKSVFIGIRTFRGVSIRFIDLPGYRKSRFGLNAANGMGGISATSLMTVRALAVDSALTKLKDPFNQSKEKGVLDCNLDEAAQESPNPDVDITWHPGFQVKRGSGRRHYEIRLPVWWRLWDKNCMNDDSPRHWMFPEEADIL
ncbi:hypothetical protein HDU76_005868, partial [Blyttiomyces sp. JEL0837]